MRQLWMRQLLLSCLFVFTSLTSQFTFAQLEDPFLWLENIESDTSLTWVKEQNTHTAEKLTTTTHFQNMQSEITTILSAQDRIPRGEFINGEFYTLWQDQNHVRGVWQRTSVEQLALPQPKWEIMLDLDQLSLQENESWVFKDSKCLPSPFDRCLISLSRGGKDAVVVREFDLASRTFLSNGFNLPEGKHNFAWLDVNHLLVGTNWGEGSMTTSGYPRLVKIWERLKPLTTAIPLVSGVNTDVSVSPETFITSTGSLAFITRAYSFYEWETYWLNSKNQAVLLKIPNNSDILGFVEDQIILYIRTDWIVAGQIYPGGSIVALSFADLVASGKSEQGIILFQPQPNQAFSSAVVTRNKVVVSYLEDVKGRLLEVSLNNNEWIKQTPAIADDGYTNIMTADEKSGNYLATFESFLQPTQLFLIKDGQSNLLKTMPHRFNPMDMSVKQLFAVSRDGTKIPYFVVGKQNSSTPKATLLYGYGGFQNPLVPTYAAIPGKVWMEKDNLYVVANIRGGGEYGPAWHLAAIKENRQKAFDDFIAVAEDLIRLGMTSPKQLGIMGGSNGGLLVGATMVQRPDLFSAVLCIVPLLDMKRFHLLLAGASWMGEFGNPDSSDWDYISQYSPYQNIKPDVHYPDVLFITSTKDDRVHPGHARKMAAKMQSYGHSALLYENQEGGHGAATNIEQNSYRLSLQYEFLFQHLLKNK